MIKKYLKIAAIMGLFLINQSYGFDLGFTDGTKIGTTLVLSSLGGAVALNKFINYAQSQSAISPKLTRVIKGYGLARTLTVVVFALSMFSKPKISPKLSLSHNIIGVNIICFPVMLEMIVPWVVYSKMSSPVRSM